ncbi:hypothetical protein OC846_003044 [Tilletia horrida]|uniref:V-type proton ATPase subunit G n=1 Tax=Tilletia horrida TaxID=155126 RepID=A0AAN6GQ76_9BASI|nr:hypothetical protein OC846_003044 [Tilletia horrida]
MPLDSPRGEKSFPGQGKGSFDVPVRIARDDLATNIWLTVYFPPSFITSPSALLPVRQAAQQSQGIQTLLEAEKEAAKIVSKARTYRTQKLKDARSEAAKDIEDLKAKKEKEFQTFQKEHEGTQSTAQSTAEKETKTQIEELNAAFEKNRSKVVDKLLERITEVHAELHRNAKKA